MKEVKACMFAFYSRAKDRSNEDMIIVKERVRDEAGVERSDLRFEYNYKRPYYITKVGYRKTHKQKKEYELLVNLEEGHTSQALMPKAIAAKLGIHKEFVRMDDITVSPYVYGTDISPTSLIKKQYMDMYPGYAPKASVAVFDLETNVRSAREEIICGSVTHKDKVILAISKEWIGNMENVEERVQEAFEHYLGKYKTERNITLYVKVVDNDLKVVLTLFKAVHKIKPDFLAIWNMAFDIDKVVDCLEYHRIDPAEVFSDPAVPKRFKRFNWRKDNPQKTTASGKTISKHVADLWHVVDAPSSFYIIDAMCFFKINRVKEQARHSYSLDSILAEELNLGKLRFKAAEQYTGLDWHVVMQERFKIEYAIYNIFDCLAMELLDEKTNDLSKAVLAGVGITDLANLKSGPKNLANEMHFFLKNQGKIICSTSPDMREEYDKLVLDMTNWILTLSSDLVNREGKPFIDDIGERPSRLYGHVFDVDISSGYPTVGAIMNISKETTLREVSSIVGLSKEELRRSGINLTALRTNAIELGQVLYGLPDMHTVLKEFIADTD